MRVDVVAKAFGSLAGRWQGPVLLRKPGGAADWQASSLASLSRVRPMPANPPPQAASPTTGGATAAVVHAHYDALGRNDVRRAAVPRKSYPSGFEGIAKGIEYARVDDVRVQSTYVFVDVAIKPQQSARECWQGLAELEKTPGGWTIPSLKGLGKKQ